MRALCLDFVGWRRLVPAPQLRLHLPELQHAVGGAGREHPRRVRARPVERGHRRRVPAVHKQQLGRTVLGLLGGMTFTAALVVGLWDRSPLTVLSVLTLVYAAGAAFLCRRLTACLRDWQTFPDSVDQLGKDRSCIERLLP